MDIIKITVLPDGTIKIDTDPISASNHVNAEAFLLEMVRLAGGTAERKTKDSRTHTHDGLTWHHSEQEHLEH